MGNALPRRGRGALSVSQRSPQGENRAVERGCQARLYLMAPVMPWANCFCRMKKTMTVGSEQNSTPSISTP